MDSDSIRATLDAAHAHRLALTSANIVSKLGEILKHARTRAHLTQTELGVRTGIDQARISKTTRGKPRTITNPALNNLRPD